MSIRGAKFHANSVMVKESPVGGIFSPFDLNNMPYSSFTSETPEEMGRHWS